MHTTIQEIVRMKECSVKTFDKIATLAKYLPFCHHNVCLSQANVTIFGKLVAFEESFYEDFYDGRKLRTVCKCHRLFKFLDPH